MATLSYRTAFFESTSLNIKFNEPFAKEKAITPTTINAEQNHRSGVFVAEISPYPTVVIVVIHQ